MKERFAIVNAEYERELFAKELGIDNITDRANARQLLEYMFFFIF